MIERVELIEMLPCSSLSSQMGKEMKEPWLIKKKYLMMIKGSMRRRTFRGARGKRGRKDYFAPLALKLTFQK